MIKVMEKHCRVSVYNCGAPILWCYKESLLALSLCEAEYIAASVGGCQILSLENLMSEMKIREELKKMLIDNKSSYKRG